MKFAIIESPFAAETKTGLARNADYARACVADSLSRGEAPFASHIQYTGPGILDDTKPEERKKGMEAGFAWARAIAPHSDSVCAVYVDRGISSGMQDGIVNANQHRLRIEFRKLGFEWSSDVD